MIGLPALVMMQADTVEHLFRIRVDVPATRVALVGTFNNWDKLAAPMIVGPDGKTFSIAIRLKPGRHQYKFVVNDENWIVDPDGVSAPDGNGNTNSILLISPADYGDPARPNDGRIARSALEHSTEVPYLNYDRGRLTLSLRTRPNDLRAVEVRLANGQAIRMRPQPVDEFYTRYVATVPWDRKRDLSYAFKLTEGDQTFEFGPQGLGDPGRVGAYSVKAKTFKPFEVPDWVEKSVLYQIFPDRFENGDRANDPADVQDWTTGIPTYGNRFGGDVAGVRKHLGHFKTLGVDTVYFNPIFKAPSNHRYDATDYLTVDPTFGTNEDFGRLTRELKSMGVRAVLDGVYNHTATNFFAFADVREKGAASRYRDWYTFRSFPVRVQENPNYVAWFNFPSMPKLNLANPETRRYMLDIPRFWDKHAAIAGWRLDVANEVSEDFWRAFRKDVKGIGKDRWIVGEVWGDGSQWLKGDQWDSVMNYRFRGAVLNFVTPTGTGKPSELMNGLMSVYSSYAPQVSRNMMNLIGSHDTPRILTLCGGDRDLAKLAAILQFTWVGAPSIYYGDELGMEGDKDPDNRRPMRWDLATPNNDFLTLYRQLVSLRRHNRSLQSGDPLPLMTDDANGTAAFARVLDREVSVVAINRSSAPQTVRIALRSLPVRPAKFIDALTGREIQASPEGILLVPVPPKGGAVLIPR